MPDLYADRIDADFGDSDGIDADFTPDPVGPTPEPVEYSPYRQLLDVIERCLALIDRVIEENGIRL